MANFLAQMQFKTEIASTPASDELTTSREVYNRI